MDISATVGYGIAVSEAKAKALGMSFDEISDKVIDALPFMTRISTGNLDAVQEKVLVLAVEYSVVTSYDFSTIREELPATSLPTKRQLDYFLRYELPGVEAGVVLSAAVSGVASA